MFLERKFWLAFFEILKSKVWQRLQMEQDEDKNQLKDSTCKI